ncbi:TolC family protein [Rubinisphaera italica]|uniref:Outer membrane efflux protein n=1 Tax=Rubinisphaera italica TaxID=2527969 RepID=A0A5C5X9P3_9PLAN|nr:TolC family protein [Rubinisphaera italica]TWT59554.1 Outer membrane efflux protein [Rubinisphaera italica]
MTLSARNGHYFPGTGSILAEPTPQFDAFEPVRSKTVNRFARGLFLFSIGTLSLALCQLTGCHWPGKPTAGVSTETQKYYQTAAAQIEYPQLEQPVPSDALLNSNPISLVTDLDSITYHNLELSKAVSLALEKSKVIRNLGVTILRSPESVTTSFDPALVESDPRFGVQAALSAFDTSFGASVIHQNNDRALNNQFFGGGTRLLQQEATVLQAQLGKQSASGTEYYLRNITDYDKNNAPGNQFPGAWTTQLEAEMRQPLLKGYGVDYWQTVGNSQTPGLYNGVLIARTNTDISQSDFEIAIRDFVAEVENAYWDLYFAYRDLETKIAARDASLELWRRVDALKQLGRAGGEADKEAQAREQYYRFEEDMQNALNGRPEDNTKTYNGTSAGSFKSNGGVLRLERRLRYLIGMPINDGSLVRPVDEPLAAPVCFNWETNLAESVDQRPELRRQKWVIKQRELEMIAAKKLLLPDLDLVALYRWRGFGETLTNPSNGGAPRFDSAYGDLASGRFQEWELGVELDVPLGNRQAHSGMRNAEFKLARARQVLKEQERVIVLELSNAMSESVRAWEVMQTVRERLEAAGDQVNALNAAYEADQAPLNLVLEAQRRFASAKSSYYSAVLDYNVAIRNVHFEKGSYLEYCGVHTSEGPWSEGAHQYAARKSDLKQPMPKVPRWIKPPRVISHGMTPDPNDQEIIAEPVEEMGMPYLMTPEEMPSEIPVYENSQDQKPESETDTELTPTPILLPEAGAALELNPELYLQDPVFSDETANSTPVVRPLFE